MKKIIFTLLMVFTLMQTFAQVSKPVVVGGAEAGDPNATMQILSQKGTKGLKMPEFTDAQMATLQPSLTKANKGLTVFNTDENCIQVWKGTAWSECDAISLAKFTFDCTASAIKGKYYAGINVDPIGDYIELTATVTKPGTYTFYTETINGVRFSYTGIVATMPTGPIKIQIPAMGKPQEVGTMAFKVFDQSGKEVCTVSNFTTEATENNAEFTISCDDTQAVGTFTEDQPVNQVTNGVSLKLEVTSSGYYSLHTNVVGADGNDPGMWFEGTDYVNTATQTTRIVLTAKGTPKWGADGKLTFTLYDKNNQPVGCTFTITLQSTKGSFTPDCTAAGVVVSGVFVETKDASSANYITLKVKPTKAGPWKITTDVVKGVYFANSGSFTDAEVTNGTAEIILFSNGTAVSGSAGLYSFKLLDASNKNAELCTPASKIEIQANQAVMACNPPYAVLSSAWKFNTPITGSAQTIIIPIDFTTTGPYNISATNAGVTLKASGVNNTVGSANVSFVATGKPTEANNTDGVSFMLTDALSFSCTRFISIAPTKGSVKEYPANTCKDALVDNGGVGVAPNGEYWIKPTKYTGTAMKTLCDMRTANAQTMVWSYSEETAKNVYVKMDSNYQFYTDKPINDNNYQSGTINYANFRMSKLAMAAIGVDNIIVFFIEFFS